MVNGNSKRLKILHIIIGTEFGGATIMVRLLCQYQMKCGHDVSVIPNNVPGARDEFLKHGIKLIDDKGIKGNIAPFSDLFHLFYWIRLMKRNGYDIVHTQTVKAGFIGRLSAKIAGVKHIIHSCHGYRLEGKFKYPIVEKIYLTIERFLSNISTVIVVQSYGDYNTALNRNIAPKKKIKVVYNGIDILLYERQNKSKNRLQFREEIGVDDDVIAIGTIGRLNKAKGHEYLIEASVQILKNKNVKIKFVFVGDGQEKDSLRKRIVDSKLEKYFIFISHRNDIPKVMQGIDIHVLPSLREGFPIVLLEAMASGKPCIATNVGGNAEAVEHGVTGFVVPSKDSKSLSKSIEKLINDKNLLNSMGEKGILRVQSKFTSEVMGKNIGDIYNNCMDASK